MIANPKFLAATAHVDEAAVAPLPNSRKVYVAGTRPDLRVPMREISQSDTPAAMGAERNPAIYVYDTSGPYTDPHVQIDIRSGLAPLRARWIEERGDTEELPLPSSEYGRARLIDARLHEMRFNLKRRPRRAKPGRNVTQMHYARQGVITPEMEKGVQQKISLLSDPSPQVRETAMQEIRKYGRFSEPILKRILWQERDARVRGLIKKLIETPPA